MNAKTVLFTISTVILLQTSCYKDSIEPDIVITKKEFPEVVADYNLIGNIKGLQTSDNVQVVFRGESIDLIEDKFFVINAKEAEINREVITLTYNSISLPYTTPIIENTTNYTTLVCPQSTNSIVIEGGQDVTVPFGSSSIAIPSSGLSKDGVPVNTANIDFVVLDDNQNGILPGGKLGFEGDQLKYCDINTVIGLSSDDVDQIEGSIVALDDELFYFDREVSMWRPVEMITEVGLYGLGNSSDYTLVKGTVRLEGSIMPGLSMTYGGQFVRANENGDYLLYENLDFNEVQLVDKCAIVKSSIDILGGAVSDVDFKPSYPVARISGILKDCSNSTLNRGYIYVEYADQELFVQSKSNDFNINLDLCQVEEEVAVSVFSEDFSEVSQRFEVQVSENKELHQLHICSNLDDEFCYINIDGKNVLFTDVEAVLEQGKIKIDLMNGQSQLILFLSDMRAGSFTDRQLNIELDATTVDNNIYEISCSSSPEGCGFELFDVIEYGDERGDFIRIYFEGRFWTKITDSQVKAGWREIVGAVHARRSF